MATSAPVPRQLGEGQVSSKAHAVIDELLQEAAAFVRGDDYTGARERVRFAQGELSRLVDAHEVDEGEAEDLEGDIELTLEHYDRLLAQWQRQNETRHASFLAREWSAILPVEAGRERES
jgi:hypothetical protein